MVTGNREQGTGNRVVVRKYNMLAICSDFEQQFPDPRSIIHPHASHAFVAASLFPDPRSPIHLQWFSDDEDAPGKTEQPTEHKIKRLREEGQVVKSQELIASLGLLLPAILLIFLAPYMLRTCRELFHFYFERAVELDPTKDRIIAAMFLMFFFRLTLPILAVGVFAALLSNIIQVGFVVSSKPLVPDLSKVVPRLGRFFKQAFSIDGMYNFFKSLIKILIIGLIAYFMIRANMDKILNLQKAGIWMGLTTIASIAIKIIIVVAVVMLIISIPDYMFQRWRFRERNKMTRHEVKEEIKMYEADPQIQSRIRSRFRDLLNQNLGAAVPQADVVVTNPTHIAVALKFDPRGPLVMALGADNLAERIRQIADEHGVPRVENKPLAWALYRETNVGETIPERHWEIVASILSKVWYLNERRRVGNSGVKMSA